MAARSSQGVTLIEVVVALFILALLAIGGYRGLTAVLQARDAVAQETRKWQQLMFFFARMEQDVAQVLHRPVRDQVGNVQPEWLGLATVAARNEAQLAFTRAGMSDAGAALLVPQRIGYRLEDDTILLLRWPALDQAANAEPQRYPLLSGVREFKLRYLSTAGGWYEQWPPSGQGAPGLPVAVEVALTLVSGEQVTRLLALQ